MERNLIIQTSIELLATLKINELSAKQVANALHISTAEVEKEFVSKEALISACFKYEIARLQIMLQQLDDEKRFNALEKLIISLVKLHHYHSNLSRISIKELQNYPQTLRAIKQCRISIYSRILHNLDNSRTEGFLLADTKSETIASLFLEQKVRYKKIQNPEVIILFIRGFCTPKGIIAINKFPLHIYNNSST